MGHGTPPYNGGIGTAVVRVEKSLGDLARKKDQNISAYVLKADQHNKWCESDKSWLLS